LVTSDERAGPTPADEPQAPAEALAHESEARALEREAHRVQDAAVAAEHTAQRAERGAHQAAVEAEEYAEAAESQAGEAGRQADTAEEQADRAEHSVEEAVEAAKQADELLLDEQARRVAAQVSEEQPFGVPVAPAEGRSDLHRGFSITTGALLSVLAAFALYSVRHELVVLLVATFIAIGLDPAVRWLVRRGLSRPVAVAVIAVIALGLFAGFLAAAFPPLAREATQLVDAAPRYAHDLQDQQNALGRLNAKYHVAEKIQQSLQQGVSVKTAGGLLSAGTAILSFTFQLLLTLVLVVYFLADLPRIKQAVYRLVPLRHRPRFGLLADEVVTRVGGYVLGNVATSVVAIVTSYILLLLLGVPYALVLSVLTGILDLIPLVGSSIAGVIVALVALATVSPTASLITVVFHVIYRVFEDYLLNPRVLRRTVDVSPLVTIVAVILGGALLGIVGALVAVPAAAAVQLVITEVVYPNRDKADV
jgi:predicted PurR-regulated permease PerM